MAASDKVKLYGIREATFGTAPTVASDTVTAASVSSGLIAFTVTTGTNFAAGQLVSVNGIEDVPAYDGVYEVESVGATDVTVYAPAGKTELGSSSGQSASIGNHVPFRLTSEDLKLTPNRTESDEITGNRGVQDVQEDGRNAGGPSSSPLIVEWLAPYMQMLSGDGWNYAGSNAEILSSGTAFSVSSNVITLGSGSWSNVEVGDMVKIYGGTNDGATGLVSVVSSGDLTVTHCSLTDHGSLSNADIVVGDWIQDDSTIYSETLERRYTDSTVGTVGAPQFPGSVLDSMSVSGGAQQSPTVSMQWQCADETSPTPTSYMGTAGPKVEGVRVNGSAVEVWVSASSGGCVQDFTLDWSNNLDPRICLGSTAVQDMEMRALSITGSLTRRYASDDEYNKFLALTDSSLMVKFKASSGATLVCWLERTNYTDGGRGAGGRNQALISTLNFQGLELADEDYTAKWFYWAR